MDTSELRTPLPNGGSRRHSRNISINKTTLTRSNLDEGELDPLADATPPLPERPADVQPAIESSRQEELPAQTLRDLSHLLRPENFHPITTDDIPPPFREPDLSHLESPTSIKSLLENGYFRAAAAEAAKVLTSEPSLSPEEIFRLVYIRLSCLTLLGHLAQAAQESRCLQDIASPFYLTTGSTRQNILPWELRVLATRLQNISINEPWRAVKGYYDLATDARTAALVASSEDEKMLWRTRLFDLGIRVANALIETGDVVAAAGHLETMNTKTTTAENRGLIRGRLGLLYLRIGNLAMARRYIVGEEDDSPGDGASEYRDILRPLLSIAEGNYSSAATQLKVSKDIAEPEQALVMTNLAVALLYAGDMKGSKAMLEELLQKDMRFPTLLFNLATIFELCTEKARAFKVQLAEDVSMKHDPLGYERSLIDFKL